MIWSLNPKPQRMLVLRGARGPHKPQDSRLPPTTSFARRFAEVSLGPGCRVLLGFLGFLRAFSPSPSLSLSLSLSLSDVVTPCFTVGCG